MNLIIASEADSASINLKNNFIKDFECRAEYLNQDSVNILNKVTNVDLKQIQRMSMTAEEQLRTI